MHIQSTNASEKIHISVFMSKEHHKGFGKDVNMLIWEASPFQLLLNGKLNSNKPIELSAITEKES
jgi:hypothetical protein